MPHKTAVTLNDFRACLNYGKSFNITLQTLTKKRDQMYRVKVEKRGLNRVFVKFPVSSDGITCTPLKQDNEFM